MRDVEPSLARRLWQRAEPLHAVTYFSAEPIGALADAGYRGFWMGYFAGRAAPLGPVGPEPVVALFYNFSTERVAKALPDAWSFAGPAAALDARLDGSVRALERILGTPDADDLARLGGLLRRAAESAPLEGRALFAANRTLPWPDEPLAVLWHAATLLREHRGDGHVAVLTAEGISGREANVLQAASGAVPAEVLRRARDYSDDEWDVLTGSLVDRGLLDDAGALTSEGWDLRDHVEARTDELAWSAYAELADAEIEAACELLAPLTRQVLTSGDVPAVGPIGRLADDSA